MSRIKKAFNFINFLLIFFLFSCSSSEFVEIEKEVVLYRPPELKNYGFQLMQIDTVYDNNNDTKDYVMYGSSASNVVDGSISYLCKQRKLLYLSSINDFSDTTFYFVELKKKKKYAVHEINKQTFITFIKDCDSVFIKDKILTEIGRDKLKW